MRLFGAVATITAIVLVGSAHIGSPDAWYEGDAGPYHAIVQVATPGVVPGVATVYVRLQGAGGAAANGADVTIQANRFDALAASPPPEIAAAVAGDPGMYSGQLWIMSGGSNSVTVNVSGALGTGKAVIPVVVVANRRLELDPRLGTALVAVGLFLFVGLVTIVGAAVRESSLAPGTAPDARQRWKARTAMAVSTVFLALALFGGSRWWNSEDADFRDSIFKPLTATATIDSIGSRPALDLELSDSVWVHRSDTSWLQKRNASRWSPLITDHGKLVHVFLIREPDLQAFAHLHPPTTDSVRFVSVLPSLPAGTYRVYGDIVHESGFAQTVSTKIELRAPVAGGGPATDADDASRFVESPLGGDRSVLEDGSNMVLQRTRGEFVAGRSAALHFAITGSDGKPLRLEPYIGMAGHAVVTRDDGAVFVHLHPAGTISMASQMAFTMRQPGDSVVGRLGQRINASEAMASPVDIPGNGVVSFPYAFPKPGKYHMWVQVKHAGRILTGAFAFEVLPAAE
ncbi:MAG TPA: hypothetical protein VGN73_11780 [Gemmatimonadaceae bacterium]|nr:hypothetical protein [Gemmatimonadaceae bacterium]